MKKSQKNRNQGFSYYVCVMTGGSRSGSVPLTNGSGSVRPKNIPTDPEPQQCKEKCHFPEVCIGSTPKPKPTC